MINFCKKNIANHLSVIFCAIFSLGLPVMYSLPIDTSSYIFFWIVYIIMFLTIFSILIGKITLKVLKSVQTRNFKICPSHATLAQAGFTLLFAAIYANAIYFSKEKAFRDTLEISRNIQSQCQHSGSCPASPALFFADRNFQGKEIYFRTYSVNGREYALFYETTNSLNNFSLTLLRGPDDQIVFRGGVGENLMFNIPE